MIRINNALRNQILDAIFNGAAGVSMLNSGVLELRSGAQPASAEDAATGTILSTINLPADAMGAAASGQVAKSGTWEDTSADNAGTAGWFRIRNAGDTLRLDGNITATGGGGDLTLDNTVLAAGQQIIVSGFTVTMPASA